MYRNRSNYEDEGMKVPQWRRREFWIIAAVLLAVFVVMASLLPNAGVVRRQILDWVVAAVFFVVLICWACFWGIVYRTNIEKIDDLIWNRQDMGALQRFFITFILSLIVSITQIWLMPWLVKNPAVVSAFDFIGLNTSWEIIPWGWAIYAIVMFFVGDFIVRLGEN